MFSSYVAVKYLNFGDRIDFSKVLFESCENVFTYV